jgi:hypothetical protein
MEWTVAVNVLLLIANLLVFLGTLMVASSAVAKVMPIESKSNVVRLPHAHPISSDRDDA